MAWALERRPASGRESSRPLRASGRRSRKGSLTNGQYNEKQELRASLEAGRLYVLDRGYAGYELLQQIRTAGSSFVCRIKDNAHLVVHEERSLDEAAKNAGIVRDAVVEVGRRTATRHLVRVVEITCRPYRKECGRKTKYAARPR